MPDINGLISVELATQLQQYSTLAHQKDKSDEDIIKLKEVGKNTLAAIDEKIDNVSIKGMNYLQVLKNSIDSSINSEYWDDLPTASKVRVDLQQIKSTIVAINEVMQFLSIDVE